MFNKARLKLTAWYLLIIMIVSIAFSALIYRVVSSEVDRFAESQRLRFERRIYIQFPNVWKYTEPQFDEEIIREIKKHILINLAQINGAILLSAGFLGYYLAGRTLKPIQEMVKEQYRFISDASHELKTPLTALRTNLEVNLREKKLSNQDAKTVLSENLAQVIKLQNLSDNLLDLTNGTQEVVRTKQPIGPIISSAIKEIIPLAKIREITVLSSGNINTTVNAQEFSLRRALVAILDNAIKYSHNKSTVIMQVKKTSDEVMVMIKDQGVGIRKKDLPHITQRFYRADSSRSTNGYGLGLSIVEKIVKTHNGRIEIKSQPNKGTTVILTIPSK